MKIYQDFINREEKRQSQTIGLIASENYVSRDVMAAAGSVFMNKYAEGYSGKRYYAGNEVVDEVEEWTKGLALEIFGLDSQKWHANVQPYSGSPANMAIYLGLLKPGDRIMSLKLSHGGHLTHGHKVSFSGKLFDFCHYLVNRDGWLDYDQIEKMAIDKRPKLIVCGATAYPRTIDFARFREIADRVGAYLVADISHIAGLIAVKVHPSCFPYVDAMMTTTHKTLRGPRGAVIVCRKELAKKIDNAVFPGLQGGPHVNVILAKGVAFSEVLSADFGEYQKGVVKNARSLAAALQENNISVLTGGTDNHLLLVDLSMKNVGAGKYQDLLETVGIIVNKNTIPYDKRSPMDPSGLRIGTPGVTTRGMGQGEMKKIARLISLAIENIDQKRFDWSKLKEKVKELAVKYPVY